jgi:hypothetical protein
VTRPFRGRHATGLFALALAVLAVLALVGAVATATSTVRAAMAGRAPGEVALGLVECLVLGALAVAWLRGALRVHRLPVAGAARPRRSTVVVGVIGATFLVLAALDAEGRAPGIAAGMLCLLSAAGMTWLTRPRAP